MTAGQATVAKRRSVRAQLVGNQQFLREARFPEQLAHQPECRAHRQIPVAAVGAVLAASAYPPELAGEMQSSNRSVGPSGGYSYPSDLSRRGSGELDAGVFRLPGKPARQSRPRHARHRQSRGGRHPRGPSSVPLRLHAKSGLSRWAAIAHAACYYGLPSAARLRLIAVCPTR
jgi:hypothetical protein